MNDEHSKFMKLSIQYQLLDNHRAHDMDHISRVMDKILDLYAQDIVWDRLHVSDVNSQIHQLEKLISMVKSIIKISNEEADRARESVANG